MSNREVSDQAFVLHLRPFTDSRQICHLFSAEHGVVNAVWRTGSRRKSSAPQQFIPYAIVYFGRNDLKTLTRLEADGPGIVLPGKALFCGVYLNELILRLLPPADPYPDIFDDYRLSLSALGATMDFEPVLRQFELKLLQAMGYGIDFFHDTDGNPITCEANHRYFFDPGAGFSDVGEGVQRVDAKMLFTGAEMALLQARDWQQSESRAVAKRLCRQALQPHLGNKPLRSRELFTS